MEIVYSNDYLAHHGILGQKWGVKNGPPYPLQGGSYTESEKNKIYRVRKIKKNSIYNKKHFDKVLSKDSKVSTLSYNKDRTKNVDMFYATHTFGDKHLYNTFFNKPIKDDSGHTMLKFKISNKLTKDIKVASEDSGAEIFKQLYKNNRDFYNFICDEKRMEDHFVKSKYKFKGYRESKKSLEKLRNGEPVTSEDVKTIYRMFNYVIPSDGNGDLRKMKDVENQRTKFFKELKKAGYSAVLDTNDAIYGSFKADDPIIVFDMDAVIPDNIKSTSITGKIFSSAVISGKKLLGI